MSERKSLRQYRGNPTDSSAGTTERIRIIGLLFQYIAPGRLLFLGPKSTSFGTFLTGHTVRPGGGWIEVKGSGGGPPRPPPGRCRSGDVVAGTSSAVLCPHLRLAVPLIYASRYTLLQTALKLSLISKPQTTTATRVFGAGEASSGTNGTRSSGARAGVLIPTPVLAGMAGTVPPDPEPPVR